MVGVEDLEFGQRVGAILTLRSDYQDECGGGKAEEGEEGQLTITKVRDDLRARLAGYKLPTLLRVLEGELPKTASGKVLKRELGKKCFPAGWEEMEEVSIWRGKAAGAKL